MKYALVGAWGLLVLSELIDASASTGSRMAATYALAALSGGVGTLAFLRLRVQERSRRLAVRVTSGEVLLGCPRP